MTERRQAIGILDALTPNGGNTVLPGFGITIGITIAYLSAMVLLPLSMVAVKVSGLSWAAIADIALSPRTLAALRVTFFIAFLAALVNALVGSVVAWVLVRYDFPGRRIFDALIDLPFALPTAVAGIALTSMYAKSGVLGMYLSVWGIKVAYTQAGIFVALLFIGLPFVVRTLQPALLDLEHELEEASATMGASRLRTIVSVIVPTLWTYVLTGFSLAFARGLGEYGSVIFISGNLPMRTEIISLLIMVRLEQFDYAGAAALGLIMLLASFLILLMINFTPAFVRSLRGETR